MAGCTSTIDYFWFMYRALMSEVYCFVEFSHILRSCGFANFFSYKTGKKHVLSLIKQGKNQKLRGLSADALICVFLVMIQTFIPLLKSYTTTGKCEQLPKQMTFPVQKKDNYLLVTGRIRPIMPQFDDRRGGRRKFPSCN